MPIGKENARKIRNFRKKTHNNHIWYMNGKKYARFQRIGYMTNPEISFGYMCKNMIKKVGYDIVRKSFSIMCDQSDDIFVVDNDGDDSEELKELCREFNFDYYNVHTNKDYDWKFDIAKVSNTIIKKAKYNIIERLSPEVYYPQNFAWYISSFFHSHDPRKWVLRFKTLNVLKDGTVQFNLSRDWTLYKPYFIECRGWDERTTYQDLEDAYAFSIMSYVYGCHQHTPDHYFLLHNNHERNNRDDLEKLNKNRDDWDWNGQIKLLKKNPKKYNRLVENSLW